MSSAHRSISKRNKYKLKLGHSYNDYDASGLETFSLGFEWEFRKNKDVSVLRSSISLEPGTCVIHFH